MRTPSSAELLDLWEDGLGRSMSHRGLALLEAIFPAASRETLAALSIGRRDAELLRLRELLWGREMTAIAACPSCREKLDVTVDAQVILVRSDSTVPSQLSLRFGELEITCRLPTTLDLVAAESAATLEGARAMLLDRCLLSAKQGTSMLDSSQLPAGVIEGIAESMAAADPLAEIQLKLNCPCCRYQWRAVFDIVSFLWTEIEAWARRIVLEVHTLARAYGWREQEILGMSSARRQLYLDMVGA